MEPLSNSDKQRIIEALKQAGAKLPCPRCGNNQFSLLDGYFNNTVQTELRGLVLGGTSVPSVVVVCSRCGFLAQHAIGALGLMPEQDEHGGEND